AVPLPLVALVCKDTPDTRRYALSLHDALPISRNANGATTSASRSQTLSAMDGMSGATLSWSASAAWNGSEYAGLDSVSRIRVWKIGSADVGTAVTVAGRMPSSARLTLRGNTAN